MTAGMQFCLLGPLLVRRGDGAVPVPAAKHRALLAALLLRAGRPVGPDELTEALWGPAPPATARVSLQNYVMRLRRILADDGPPRIVTEPGGYLIRVGPGELDIIEFESALAAGRAAARAGAWDEAAAALAGGLALWRGEPLAAVPSEVLLAREGPRLAELRLQALEARIDAELHRGRAAEVIVELRGLVAAQPLRERLHAQLMAALAADGQQAGALAAYQAARRVLVDELGAEPGPELQRLQQQVLVRHQPGRAAPGPPAPAPLTGRDDELARLTGLLDQAARYRSLLAGRRMLVVLENAASAEHVRPLLPGAAGCAALVTSRDPLAGLVARDGARRLDLGPRPPGSG